jgi:hypothetical protein
MAWEKVEIHAGGFWNGGTKGLPPKVKRQHVEAYLIMEFDPEHISRESARRQAQSSANSLYAAAFTPCWSGFPGSVNENCFTNVFKIGEFLTNTLCLFVVVLHRWLFVWFTVKNKRRWI